MEGRSSTNDVTPPPARLFCVAVFLSLWFVWTRRAPLCERRERSVLWNERCNMGERRRESRGICARTGGVSHRTLACGYVMCGRVCKGKGVCRRYKNERDRRFPCDVARCVKLWTDCACVFIRLSLEQKHGSRLNRSASHRPLSRPHHLHRLRVRHQTIVSVVQMARHADAILQKVAKAHPSVRIREPSVFF